MKTYKKCLLAGSLGLASATAYAACPQVTVENDRGVTGKYPQQFELQEFESLADCKLSFRQNPSIQTFNVQITGNPKSLPSVKKRLPDEPLVVAPYQQIGKYGGMLNGLSNATESGTSDLLSVRHVNLVRYADDLVTIVPNIAKSYQWNSDFTELTFTLRKEHKWSNGEPFTAADIEFWYNHMVMDPQVIKKPKDVWKAGGKPIEVIALDEVTVLFKFQAPKPGMLSIIAQNYAQPFQPKHFLGKFHPAINPKADELATKAGFQDGYEVINFYYGGSDWKDVPSPLLKDASKIKNLPAAVLPTLESHILIEESTEGRRLVANPYFHMVDTAGNQLPYINEIRELYVSDTEVRILKLINSEVDYKSQSLNLANAPALLDGQEAGDYQLDIRPSIAVFFVAFNFTAKDEEKRELFNNKKFLRAMSHAINRDEINETAFFGLGKPQQYITFDPAPDFATEQQKNYAIEFDPDFAQDALDELGVIDQNGDGFRDLPSGKPLTFNLVFSTQFMAASTMELVAQHWANLGFRTEVKEVTTDEYRASQSANELDVIVGKKGRPLSWLIGDPQFFTIPFGTFFDSRNGMLWLKYIDSQGKEGIQPPDWAVEMGEKVIKWQQYQPGTPQSNKLGNELVQLTIDNMPFIGLISGSGPIYHSNKLKNFETPKIWAYEYYRVYPYRPNQWFFDK